MINCVVALDVGGTSVKSGLVTHRGQIIHEPKTTSIASQASADAILSTLVEIIANHLQEFDSHGGQLLGVGVGFPGPFEYDTGISRIQGVAKYESIYGLNIGQALQQRLGRPDFPIRFRNDAEAAIVGEGLYGVGQPFSRLIGLTLGTGCGSAFLINGQPITSGTSVPPNGWLYPIEFQGRQADDIFSIRGLMQALQEAGIVVDDLKSAAALARQDHRAARQVFAQFGHNLGTFLHPWAEAFQAEAILLQGGIAQAFDVFEPELLPSLPMPVVRGELGMKAALLGAAALFFS